MDVNKAAPASLGEVDFISSKEGTSELESNPCLKSKFEKEYAGNWIWRALSAYIDTKDFHPSPKKIAAKLNIHVEEAVDALEGLIELGIIRRTEAGYEKILKYIYFSDRQFDKRLILADHVLVSTQILGKLDPFNKAHSSFYRTGFLSTSHKVAKEFRTKFDALMKEFIEISQMEKMDTVYALSLSCLEIINSRKEGPNEE